MISLTDQKFPKQFIKKGKFKLHSGEITDTFYDVNEMITDSDSFDKIMDEISKYALDIDCVVGIATGGAILASHRPAPFSMIKDKNLKGKVVGDYLLIDDVCTTENSIKEAIKIIGRKPKAIFVVVDRRNKKTLKINSMYQVQ